MVELVRGHRTDDAQFIGDGLQMRNCIREPHPAVSALLEFTGSPHQFGYSGRKGKPLAFQEFLWTVLVRMFDKLGFVVEQIEVRWRTGQVQVDDLFCLRREMRLPGRQWIDESRAATTLSPNNAASAAPPMPAVDCCRKCLRVAV